MKSYATRNNYHYWEDEHMGGQTPVAQQAPSSDPNSGATGGPPAPAGSNQGANQPEPEQDDVEKEPQSPEMPQEKSDHDFEQWRHEFFKLSIKSDTNDMMSSINQIRDREGLEPSQKRFVEDNLQILLYRQDANVQKATREIRKLVEQDLDRTNPGTTVMQHIMTVLEQDGLLQQVLIKLSGLYGLKGELHRKFLSALLGSVQVGGGNNHREDLIYSAQEYTINLSTRFYTQFGEMNLGAWSLKEDDPERYLTEPEMDRLHEGSPEEKQVLRRRIILESIAEEFQKRAFLIHCVHTDGTICSIGWDLGSSLTTAYREGKLVVRGQKSESRDAQVNDNGEIVPLIDLDILYVQETGETDDYGRPEYVEVPFMERRDSMLYLVADIDVIQEATAGMGGIFFRELPYGGNPSDVLKLQRCVPDLSMILNQKCVGYTTPETQKQGGGKPFVQQQGKSQQPV